MAQRLREARKKRGFTQGMLAKLAGLSQTAISAYERGLMDPTVGNLLALAKALKVAPAWLLGHEPEEKGETFAPPHPTEPLPPGLEDFLNSPVGRNLRVAAEEVGWLLALASRWDASPEQWMGRLIALRWLRGKSLDGSDNPDEALWGPHKKGS